MESFCLTFYMSFPIIQLATVEVSLVMGPTQQNVFEKAKSLLISSCMLTHYDLSKPLILACDASPYGIDAVLSYKVWDD